MTNIELSNEFDTLLNSYRDIKQQGVTHSVSSIELDEYEKSVLLTDAQDQFVLELYTGKNITREAFEETEEVREYLSEIISTSSITSPETLNLPEAISSNSVFYKIPEDAWFILYESCRINDISAGALNNTNMIIKPTAYDKYNKISRNPFKSTKKRAFRLDAKGGLKEIISKYIINRYFVRYISKPDPIILVDLPDDLSINNISVETTCKLNPAAHRLILLKAIGMTIRRHGGTQ